MPESPLINLIWSWHAAIDGSSKRHVRIFCRFVASFRRQALRSSYVEPGFSFPHPWNNPRPLLQWHGTLCVIYHLLYWPVPYQCTQYCLVRLFTGRHLIWPLINHSAISAFAFVSHILDRKREAVQVNLSISRLITTVQALHSILHTHGTVHSAMPPTVLLRWMKLQCVSWKGCRGPEQDELAWLAVNPI